MERKWHKSQSIEENLDGSIILTLTVNHLLELKNWVLSWGKNAQVLEPVKFLAMIKDDIRSLANVYFD